MLLVYIISLIASSGFSIAQGKRLRKADRYLRVLLIITLLTEIVSELSIRKFRNNMVIFHIFSPIELLLLSLYFNEKISLLKKYHVGITIGILGIVIALLNALFIQPINTINSVFLLFEGFSIIALSLFAFYMLVLKKEEIIYNTHFWFTTIILTYWSAVFVYFGMYPFFLTILKGYMEPLTLALRLINIAAYFGFALVFLNYKKMTVNGG